MLTPYLPARAVRAGILAASAAVLLAPGAVVGQSVAPGRVDLVVFDDAPAARLAVPSGPPSAAGGVARRSAVSVPEGALDALRVAAAADAPLAVAIGLFADLLLEAELVPAGSTATGDGLAFAGDAVPPGGALGWPVTVLVYPDGLSVTVHGPGGVVYGVKRSGGGYEASEAARPPWSDEPVVVDPEVPWSPTAALDPAASSPLDDGSVIDVAVVYTPAAAAGAALLPSVWSISGLADLMFADANSSLAASGVGLRLRLAHLGPISYVESGPSTDTRRLAGRSDGYMDDVHALRDAYSADLVHLVTDWDVDDAGSGDRVVCGRAQMPSSPTPQAAFGATDYFCVDLGTFAHEIGHNLGLAHDRWQSLREAPPETHGYRHGYVNLRMFDPGAPVSSRWHTVMAYSARCYDHFGLYRSSGCRRARLFSNPRLTHMGDPAGVPATSSVAGPDGPADASRGIRDTKYAVANYRVSGGTPPGSPDLRLTGLRRFPDGPPLAPGQLFDLAVDVVNRGSAASPPAVVEFRRGPARADPPVARRTVGGLGAGGRATVSAALAAPPDAGAHVYRACLAPARTGGCSEDLVVRVGVANRAPS